MAGPYDYITPLAQADRGRLPARGGGAGQFCGSDRGGQCKRAGLITPLRAHRPETPPQMKRPRTRAIRGLCAARITEGLITASELAVGRNIELASMFRLRLAAEPYLDSMGLDACDRS
jgi:hypothetical protein